jgi:K+-sensing histidine kinase KdpD
MIARRLGLNAYVSVPVVVARHQLFGMLCGASRTAQPISESTVSVMEYFAQIISDHVTRASTAATEERARSAEEQLRVRAMFLAQAEHQLKTPLAVIVGASVLLRDQWFDLPNAQRTELLAMLVRNALSLTDCVEQLLIEARTDVQARELKPSLVELEPSLRTIAAAFDSVSSSHDIVAEVPTGLVAWVDPIALNQVLGHLLDNAIKYSPNGGTIRVHAARTPENVRIDLVDEGVGLPESRAIDIFEPFQRGDQNAIATMPGVGLGLHIVRTLVTAIGGSIDGNRNPDGGSTFTIRLPASP